MKYYNIAFRHMARNIRDSPVTQVPRQDELTQQHPIVHTHEVIKAQNRYRNQLGRRICLDRVGKVQE